MHSPIDEAARNLLNSKLAELETYLNADVIVYYGEIFDSVEIQIKKIVEELQSEKELHSICYIILTTPEFDFLRDKIRTIQNSGIYG